MNNTKAHAAKTGLCNRSEASQKLDFLVSSESGMTDCAQKNHTGNIEKYYWKGLAYPLRNIYAKNSAYTVSVERLLDMLIDDMRSGQYEAMEAANEIDFYCTDEEMHTLSDIDLYTKFDC